MLCRAFFVLLCSVHAPCAPQRAIPAGELLGIVRSASGQPVEGAALRFCGDRLSPLEEAALGSGTSARIAESETGSGGKFRFPVPRRSGSLWVTTRDGLGAVIPLVRVATPVAVTVQPLATLATETGADFRCLVEVLRPGREPSRLADDPTPPGKRLELPPGRFLLLLGTEDGWSERTVDLEPGQRAEVDAPPLTGQTLPGPAGTAEAARWPELRLPFEDGLPVRLAGPDIVTQRVRHGDELRLVARTWFDPARKPAIPTPRGQARALEVRSSDGEPLLGAVSSTWTATPGGLVLTAEGQQPPGNHALQIWIPEPAVGSRVLVQAPGHRPRSVRGDQVPSSLQLDPSQPCELRVRVPGIRPAAIRVQEPGDPCVAFEVLTDARGHATLPHTPTARAEISITAPGCAPLRGTFDALGLPDRTLDLDAGSVLRGRVVDESGEPAPLCEVEVRDPSGALLASPRRTMSDDSGRFEVEGLPEGTYTISVRDFRDGRTFSGQTRGAQPGRDSWDVTIRDEDPKRPGGGRSPAR